jgi:uncharacterized cupin superfamily protein
MPQTIVRTRELRPEQGFRGRHPFNPASEIHMLPISRMAGMKRAHLNLMRLSPGKESFIPHAHALQEEYVFVLEGTGTVTLAGEAHAIGPGDYVGFPTDGVVHHLTNTGEADLVYLTGGESTPLEVSRFPTLGKVAVFTDEAVTLYDAGSAETIAMSDWFARAQAKAD